MTSKEIWKKQRETIAYVKNYLIKCKKSKIDTANSSFCYFAHWCYTPGTAKLKLKLEGTKYILSYFQAKPEILKNNTGCDAAHGVYVQRQLRVMIMPLAR